MRKIIYAQLVSLDGYIEDSEGNIDWTKPNDDLHRHFNELEKNLSINFYGRRMSKAMDYWLTAGQQPDAPETEIEYARAWQNNKRIVFSKTLTSVEGDAELRREINPEEIRSMKNQPGKDMSVGGSTLAASFIKYGLVDEFRLYIHPVSIGGGMPMFPLHETVDLKFAESQTFSGGIVMLKYHLKNLNE